MTAALEIQDLTLSIGAEDESPIIDGLSIRVEEGELVALVGESGSGKSMTALSVAGFLPLSARRSAAKIDVAGLDVLRASRKELAAMRGGRLGMLFQQPKRLLDPTSTVGTQIAEPLRLHRRLSRREAKHAVVGLLHDVGVNDPERRAASYPHQLSGGLAQRVMIAIALAGHPRLLIADEPTTALDATIQAQILELIAQKQREMGMGVLFISHDLGVVSSIADRIAVMYAGRILEEGPAAEIMRAPRHPYTQALVRCSLLIPESDGQLYTIPGTQQAARELTAGCRFAPRCPVAKDDPALRARATEAEPPLEPVDGDRLVRCWHAREEAVR